MIDEIRRDVYNYKALDPAEKLIALSKRVGTEDMVIAACQYFRALDKFLDAGGLNGLRNRQRVSAVDDAWKRLQAVFVRFVR